jgi:aspartokinase/homoserine dehydrogenase 1
MCAPSGKVESAVRNGLEESCHRHRSVIDDLLGKRHSARLRSHVDTLLCELHEVLHGIQLLGHGPPRALDLVASFGERLCALIISAHLTRSHPARFVDARQFIVTDDQFMSANVVFGKTNRMTRRYFAELFRSNRPRAIPVVTGFIGSTE